MLVVLLEDVTDEVQEEDIKLYLRTKTYLDVNNAWFWEKLRYALPQIPLAKLQQQRGENEACEMNPIPCVSNQQPANEPSTRKGQISHNDRKKTDSLGSSESDGWQTSYV